MVKNPQVKISHIKLIIGKYSGKIYFIFRFYSYVVTYRQKGHWRKPTFYKM